MEKTLHYVMVGDGEPLVLLHGLASCKEAWLPQHALAKNYKLIIPDMRGHGTSPVGDKPFSVQQFAEDVVQLLNTLEIDRFHLCGLSMGGLVAQQVALTEGHRVRSLILANTLSYVPYVLGWLFVNKRVKRFNTISRQKYELSAAKACVYHADSNEMLERIKPALCFRKDSYVRAAESLMGVCFRKELNDLEIPALLIGSQYDAITPVYAMIDMKRMIPNSDLVIFRNTGHISNIEAADRFNKHVLAFLERVS